MEKFEILKCKTKESFYRNKEKIKTCVKIGACGIGGVIVTFLIIDNRKKQSMINCMGDIIIAQSEKIDELNKLCKKKMLLCVT